MVPSLGIAVGYNPGVEEWRCRAGSSYFFPTCKEQRRHEQAQARRHRQASREEEEAEGAAGRGEVVSSAFPAV
jgi:hypothetical protein